MCSKIFSLPQERSEFNRSTSNGPHFRIFYGRLAYIGERPWHAVLSSSTENGSLSLCQGALIRVQWVLTAAHCILGTVHTLISLGFIEKGASDFTTNATLRLIHSKYEEDRFRYDIALLLMEEEYQGKDISPIRLIGPSYGSMIGLPGFISGVGRTERGNFSDYLLTGHVLIDQYQYCEEFFGPDNFYPLNMCIGKDYKKPFSPPCTGDSGGPLTVQTYGGRNPEHYLAGLFSYGGGYCGTRKHVVYTRVNLFTDWINKGINRSRVLKQYKFVDTEY